MKYGAYHRRRKKDIVWFRTKRSIQTGFYRRHSHSGKPPDVYVAESVPGLIMKVYPWIHEEETAFQKETGGQQSSVENDKGISDRMTEGLIQRLDPDDDTVWINDPHWVKHLKKCPPPCTPDDLPRVAPAHRESRFALARSRERGVANRREDR